MHNSLFDAVTSADASMQAESASWLASFEKDPTDAIKELVNFVLKSAGCEFPIEKHDVEQDNASGTLNEVQMAVIAKGTGECILISRTAPGRAAKANFGSFFEWLVENAAIRDTLYTDEDFIKRILSWIAVLTASRVRSFRYVAVVALFAMAWKLCQLREALRDQEERNRKAIADGQKSKRKKAGLFELERKVKESELRRQQLEAYFSKLETSVFANRRKDVDPRIRTACIQALGSWMETSPDTFVVTSYLKYLEFASSDASASVRTAALEVLLLVLSIDESIPMLGRFLKRFKGRCVEIALHDVEASVRRSAVELLVHATDQGNLSEEEVAELSKLIYDVDERIRKSAARLVLTHVENELSELWDSALSSSDLEKQQAAHEDMQESWPRFKLVANLLESQNSSSVPSDISSHAVSPHLNRNALAAEAILQAGKKDLPEWSWNSLADYLVYDFSDVETELKRAARKGDAATKAYLDAFVVRSASTTTALLDMFVGFVNGTLASIAVAERNGRRRQEVGKTGTVQTQDDVFYRLIELLPELNNTHGSNPDAAVRILRLQSLLTTDTFRRLHKEQEQAQLFEMARLQFMNHLSPAVHNECLRIFGIACTQDPFAETARAQLRDSLDDVAYGLKDVLSHSSPRRPQLIAPLARLDRLGECVDITSILVANVGNSSATIADKLLSTADPLDVIEENDKAYYKLLMSLLRLHFVWNLASVVTPWAEYNSGEAEQALDRTALEYIDNVIRAEWPLIRHTAASATLSSYLDVVVMAKTLEAKFDDAGRDDLSSIPTNLPDSTQAKIMQLYLAKEIRYAELANVHLKEDPDLTGDVDESATPDDDYGTVTTADADYDLCAFAAKIQVAATVGIVHDKYHKRLALNSRVLSPRYRSVLKGGLLPSKAGADDGDTRKTKTTASAVVDDESDEEMT